MPYHATDIKRFASDMLGKPVFDSGGDKIGEIETFYYDFRTGEAEWVGVRTGFLGSKRVLVPVKGAQVQNGGNPALRVPFPKDMVKDTPDIDDEVISDETERELYAHYGMTAPEARSDEGAGVLRRRPGEADDLSRPNAERPLDQKRSHTRRSPIPPAVKLEGARSPEPERPGWTRSPHEPTPVKRDGKIEMVDPEEEQQSARIRRWREAGHLTDEGKPRGRSIMTGRGDTRRTGPISNADKEELSPLSEDRPEPAMEEQRLDTEDTRIVSEIRSPKTSKDVRYEPPPTTGKRKLSRRPPSAKAAGDEDIEIARREPDPSLGQEGNRVDKLREEEATRRAADRQERREDIYLEGGSTETDDKDAP